MSVSGKEINPRRLSVRLFCLLLELFDLHLEPLVLVLLRDEKLLQIILRAVEAVQDILVKEL